ncbi:MAG: DMT family transporter [Dermatophilaceae bacterium]
MTRRPRVPWQAKYLALALIWGSSFLLMKVGLAALHPIQISTLRILAGAAVLVVLLRMTGARLPRQRRVWGHLAFCSLFLTVLPFTGFVVGETRVSSALAGIGNAATPIVAVLVGLVLLPSERLTGARLSAVVAGFVGVVVIAEPWNLEGRPDPLGFAVILAAASCYGVGWIWNRRFLADADLGGLSQPAALLVCGAVLVLPVWLGWWWLDRDRFDAPWSLAPDASMAEHPVWLALACTVVLGVLGTGLAYMFQYDVARGAGAIVSTTVTYLIPVVSVLLGVLVLGERLGAAQLAGFAVVLSAAVVINRRPRVRPLAGAEPVAAASR